MFYISHCPHSLTFNPSLSSLPPPSANGSVLALGLPPHLTWNKFQKHYAKAVGTQDTTIQERARYFQLYKAFDSEEGEYMPMILQAKGGQVLAF